MTPNATMLVGGWITQEKFILGKTPEEMEAILGFRPGRLGQGVCILALNRLPREDEFEFGGYTYWPGGNPVHGSKGAKFDEKVVKASLIRELWRLSGPDRLVKVIPNVPHTDLETYPIGKGAPQWKIKSPVTIPATVVACLKKGEPYLPYGRRR